MHIYFKVTENEIKLGILDAENTQNNAVYFERKLLNVENITDKTILSKYFDLDENGHIDKKSEKLLEDLKRSKIRNKLPSSNIFEFEVKNFE